MSILPARLLFLGMCPARHLFETFPVIPCHTPFPNLAIPLAWMQADGLSTHTPSLLLELAHSSPAPTLRRSPFLPPTCLPTGCYSPTRRYSAAASPVRPAVKVPAQVPSFCLSQCHLGREQIVVSSHLLLS